MKISIARLKEIIMEEVARATLQKVEKIDEGLGDTIASPFIKLLNALLPQIPPEKREEMMKDWIAALKEEAAKSPAETGRSRPFADRYGGDYDITGIAPQDYEHHMESLNIEIVDDE